MTQTGKEKYIPWEELGEHKRYPWVEKSRYLIDNGYIQGVSLESLSKKMYEKEHKK